VTGSSTLPIAVVTGASRGIGRAVAAHLGAAGWHVVGVARSQKALEALDDAIQAAGGEAATLVPLDLKDGPGIDRLGHALYERFGRIDGLVACGGVLGALSPAFNATPRVMEEVIAVNLIANHRLIRSFHPLLRASAAGRAVFVTSNAARHPKAYWGPYAASKAGLEALVMSYAQEIEITPIKANLFNPGPVRTAMRAKAYPGEDPASLVTPEAVAPAIAALLAPSFMDNGTLVSFR